MEEWKDVKGYEGLYQVSDLGNVRSLNYKNTGEIKEMSQSIKDGYCVLRLCKNKTASMYRVHRLVAEAFIDNQDGLPIVNHIDGNKTNNHVSNLEWCTQQHNMKHAFTNGLCEQTKEAAVVNVRKAQESHKKPVRCITTGKEFGSIYEAATYYGMHNGSNIINCCRGKRKSAGKLNGVKLCWEYI